MNADAVLRQARRAALQRALARTGLLTAPWLIVAAALAWALAMPWSALVLAAPLVITASLLWIAARQFDDRWLARALNARRQDMDDSADLLLMRSPPASALERLQRERLRQRLQAAAPPDLRAPWRVRPIATNAVLAAACLAAITLWPAPSAPSGRNGFAPPEAAAASQPPQLLGQRIDIEPPPYTGLPVRSVDALAAKVAEGSTLQWTLRFAPMPQRAELVFHDGYRLALEREGDAWTGRRRLDESALYRIGLEHPLALAQSGEPLHRIEVVPDRPPQVDAVRPQRNLTLLAPGQRRWALAFEASDDHGLASTAQLRITRTEGSGENITSTQQTLSLRGRGGATQRRYTHEIDLDALGLVEGDDVIVQLRVSDRRTPAPQTTRSPSFILRWPPDPGIDVTGLDGLVKKTLPAYFRSQRQIIIDAEALLEEKLAISPDAYRERSDGIGVDQRLLRLRYGQFLGEESESAPRLMPTNDARDEHEDEGGEDGHAPGDANARSATATASPAADSHDDDHGHAADPQRQPSFGEEQSVLEQFGHTHDIAEAATLLDPQTRALLRAALDEMWQSELHLRQAQPELALPYANRALGFIKQVQQASRIYLPRLGTQLPPIDENRRLGGDREGLGDRADLLAAATAADPVPADAWRALAPLPGAGAVDLDALSEWLATGASDRQDPLEVAAAIDTLRRDPGCAACRKRLRALLWPLLAAPPPAIGPRRPAGPVGQAYLDALGQEPTP
ncbi:hypothetical protein [Lysobacter sp. D1-1-M9]|uniref:hypothetical protein n=1 Tax=Novilysobacter longmucuonensis TaxID=3098603 RepID=UPI0039832764